MLCYQQLLVPQNVFSDKSFVLTVQNRWSKTFGRFFFGHVYTRFPSYYMAHFGHFLNYIMLLLENNWLSINAIAVKNR